MFEALALCETQYLCPRVMESKVIEWRLRAETIIVPAGLSAEGDDIVVDRVQNI